jgi:hypothetical protein
MSMDYSWHFVTSYPHTTFPASGDTPQHQRSNRLKFIDASFKNTRKIGGTITVQRLKQSSSNKKLSKILSTFILILVKASRNIARAKEGYPFSCAALAGLLRQNTSEMLNTQRSPHAGHVPSRKQVTSRHQSCAYRHLHSTMCNATLEHFARLCTFSLAANADIIQNYWT